MISNKDDRDIKEPSKLPCNQLKINLQDREWQYFSYEQIFDYISRGERLIKEDREEGNIPYFSASEFNNGWTDSISNPLFIEKDAIIYTTFGDAYFIKGQFTASDEISIFKNKHLNMYKGLFLSTIISNNKFKYSFGRKAFKNKFIKDLIPLPVDNQGNPDWQFMEDYIKQFNLDIKEPSKLPYKQLNITLQDRDWKYFTLQDVFNITRGNFKNVSNIDYTNNKGIPVITASEGNNGISAYTTNTSSKTYKNAITIANNGSIGSAFYQADVFTATSDISILSNKFLSLYNSLFITSIIFKEKYRFNYGRKWGINRMKTSLIKLPIDTQGNPDWQFMEDYIKSLPYSKSLA